MNPPAFWAEAIKVGYDLVVYPDTSEDVTTGILAQNAATDQREDVDLMAHLYDRMNGAAEGTDLYELVHRIPRGLIDDDNFDLRDLRYLGDTLWDTAQAVGDRHSKPNPTELAQKLRDAVRPNLLVDRDWVTLSYCIQFGATVAGVIQNWDHV